MTDKNEKEKPEDKGNEGGSNQPPSAPANVKQIRQVVLFTDGDTVTFGPSAIAGSLELRAVLEEALRKV